jgi:hypothetical protein
MYIIMNIFIAVNPLTFQEQNPVQRRLFAEELSPIAAGADEDTATACVPTADAAVPDQDAAAVPDQDAVVMPDQDAAGSAVPDENATTGGNDTIVLGDTPMSPLPLRPFPAYYNINTPDLYNDQCERARLARLEQNKTPVLTPKYPLKRKLVFDSETSMLAEIAAVVKIKKIIVMIME